MKSFHLFLGITSLTFNFTSKRMWPGMIYLDFCLLTILPWPFIYVFTDKWKFLSEKHFIVMMFNIFCIWRRKRSWLKAGNFMVLWAHQGISTEPLGPSGILKILNLFQPRSHHLHTLYSLSFLKRLRLMNKQYNMKILGSNNLGLFNIAFRP